MRRAFGSGVFLLGRLVVRLRLVLSQTSTLNCEGDAALLFPRNTNVIATLARAGPGFENVSVTLVADPAATSNRHADTLTAAGCKASFAIESTARLQIRAARSPRSTASGAKCVPLPNRAASDRPFRAPSHYRNSPRMSGARMAVATAFTAIPSPAKAPAVGFTCNALAVPIP